MASEKPKFQHLPSDCTCNGEALALVLVRREPQFGGMPELRTYRCPKCGHVETVEAPTGGTA